MNGAGSPEITITVFSARAFFTLCGGGLAGHDGYVRKVLTLPTGGIAEIFSSTNGSSLEWIDGAFAHTIQCERFTDSIRQGEIPEPILAFGEVSLQRRIIHSAPATLLRSRRTVISALGLTEPLCQAALRAKTISCAGCGTPLSRFSHPLELVEVWSNSWKGRKVTVSVEGDDSRLSEWARSRGFSATRVEAARARITLDTTVLDQTSTTPLTTTLQSLWRIPNVVFSCGTDSSLLADSPHGWCSACHRAADTVSRAQVMRLIDGGLPLDAPKPTEAGLVLDCGHPLGDILTTPLQTLRATSPSSIELSPLGDAAEVLRELNLSHLALGDQTDLLSASDLAKLSVAASVLCARSDQGIVVIDLPRGLGNNTTISEIRSLCERHLSSTPVIMVGGDDAAEARSRSPQPLSTAEDILGTLTIAHAPTQHSLPIAINRGASVHISEDRTASRSLFFEITEALSSSQSTPRVSWNPSRRVQTTAIPLFATMPPLHRLVFDELGFADAVARLFAASRDARVLGLTPKDFTIAPGKKNPHLCPSCRGLGVLLSTHERLPRPLAAPCHTCDGNRFKPPIASILFRGASLARLLNQPIADSIPLLRALAKSSKPIALLSAFELLHLPLGMPVALVSSSESRALSIVAALCKATPQTPAIIVLEEAGCALTGRQRRTLDSLIAEPDSAAAVVEVS